MRKPTTMSTLISNTTKSTTTPCCTKVGLKRGPWTPEEDKVLSDFINKEGEGRWRTLPKRAGLLRCGKSCRLRWMNYLRPSVKRGQIAPDEEDLILRLHRLLGNRWSLIAGRIPGRTDNEIKNFWNTHLSKKLISQGIDPRTHKPLTNTVITTDDDHQLMVTTSAVSPSATTAQKNDRNNASNCLVTVVNGRGSAATATSSSDIISSAIGRLVEHHHASDGSLPLQLFQSYVHDNDDHFQAEMIDNGNNNFLNHHSNNINGDDTQDHQCTDDEIINYSCGGEDVFSTFLNSLINEDDVFINNTGQMVHVQHPVQHNQFMQANHQQPILTDDMMISVNPLAHESDKSSFGFVDGSNAATSNNIDGNWGMINAATLMSAPGNTVFGEQSCGRRFTDEHDDDHQRQF